MTFIKFCGITNYEDAKFALDLGVDALGFNFSKSSKRYIDPEQAKIIIRRLPPKLMLAGVFVNSSREEVDLIARTASLDTIQLHGDETETFCANWNELKVIKALRIGEGGHDLQDCIRYSSVADYLLLDAYSSKEYGGTGKEIDPILLKKIPKEIFEKTLLSGGLNSENVASKVNSYKPYGIDVASGIEASPGKKSKEKMEAFIRALRDRS